MKMMLFVRDNLNAIKKDVNRDYLDNGELEKTLECFHFLEKNGFSGYSNEIEYCSDEFYRFLELVGEKYPFVFKPIPKLTKKEMDNQKAFTFESRSLIPVKNAPYYSRWDDIPFEKKCFNLEDPFTVCTFTTAEIKGSMTWKPNYFKATDSGIIRLVVSQEIKDLIETNHITGCHFGTIRNTSKKTTEPAYALSADSLMIKDFIIDKLSVIKELERESKKYISHTGALLFSEGTLGNIKDFSYANKATSIGNESDIIVSQKFRQFYLQNKLKGGSFENIFEVGTESFEWYNVTIKSLAKDLTKYNTDHSIGWVSYIPAHKLLGGIL